MTESGSITSPNALRPVMRNGTTAILAGLLLFAAACAPSPETTCSTAGAPDLETFTGVFGGEDIAGDAVVSFRARHDELLMEPALWSGPMVLRRVGADSFVVATHPRFSAAFERDADGCVRRARVHGVSPDPAFARLDGRPLRPVQLLMDGRPAEAAEAYVEHDAVDGAETAGRRLMRSAPTRADDTAAFFAALARLRPSASIHAAHGDALTAAGDRDDAQAAYERAVALDPDHEPALRALERLGARTADADGAWRLPFALDDVFDPPRPSEIGSVWTRWERRDLSPRGVETVFRTTVDLDGLPAEARVVAHRVHGRRHYGVVIVPEGAAGRRLPVIVEAKGVSPSFFPLDVPGGLTSPYLLGDARGDAIYVAPGYRGERVIVGTDTLVSEGDRSDAWDGATDDLIAFLHAALEVTPEADTSRVCVFGRSRGGTVALLAGLREPRIDCVAAWAAPTDWIGEMGLGGWTQAELVAEGLRRRSVPGEIGGQFIDYFLRPALEGRRGLGETRLHLVASSPRFFAERLPRTQAHWGLEDSIVPSANGDVFVERYEAVGRPSDCLDVRFHPNAGHDQDRQLAPMQTRAFLLDAFAASPDDLAACRP